MDDLQLSDADPSQGLRLESAMGWYGDQAIAQMYPSQRIVATIVQSANYSARRGLKPGDVSYVDPDRLPELQRKAALRDKLLLTDIAAQLRSSKLYALGLRVGEYTPTRIPREWWGVATLDPLLNTAEGSGVTFSGLLIFESAPEKAVEAEPLPELARASAWMHQNVTSASKRAGAIEQCRQAVGVTDQIARQAWNALPQDRKRGRGIRILK